MFILRDGAEPLPWHNPLKLFTVKQHDDEPCIDQQHRSSFSNRWHGWH